MPDRLLGVFGHEGLELAFCALVVEKGFPGVAEEGCELGPRVRRAHIDNADRLDARLWRLCHNEVGDFAGLHAPPKLLFRRHQNGEIERVHRNGDLDHLPPPVMMESTELRLWVTHILCWTCAMYFSAAASSENDQGSMNLASNTASVPSTIPSRVAAIHGIAECLTRRCTSRTCRPVLRSYQERLSSPVALPSCPMRFPDRSSVRPRLVSRAIAGPGRLHRCP